MRGYAPRQYDQSNQERPPAQYLDAAIEKDINQAHYLALEFFKPRRMDEPDYFKHADVFEPKQLHEDFKEVSKQRARYHQYDSPENKIRKQVSDVQEAMTTKGIQELDWFGSNFTTAKRNDFDDFRQQIDIIAIHRTRNSENELKLRALLAIDVTSSEKGYQEKLEMIQTKIDKMPQTMKCKYFVDEQTGRYGSVLIPQIALYSPLKDLVERLPNWINHEKDSTPIQNDPLQMEYLQQALLQTTLFMNLVAQAGKKGGHGEYQMQTYRDLMKRYATDVKLIRNTVIAKARQSGQYPKPTETLPLLSEVAGLNSATLKQYALGAEQDPVLIKLLERIPA